MTKKFLFVMFLMLLCSVMAFAQTTAVHALLVTSAATVLRKRRSASSTAALLTSVPRCLHTAVRIAARSLQTREHHRIGMIAKITFC